MSEPEVLGSNNDPSNVIDAVSTPAIDMSLGGPTPAPIPPLGGTAYVSSKPSRLSEVDRMALELAKSQRQVSLAEAKTALANNEKSELQYKYVVLQIYMKYGLTESDALNESGDILYGGANSVK